MQQHTLLWSRHGWKALEACGAHGARTSIGGLHCSALLCPRCCVLGRCGSVRRRQDGPMPSLGYSSRYSSESVRQQRWRISPLYSFYSNCTCTPVSAGHAWKGGITGSHSTCHQQLFFTSPLPCSVYLVPLPSPPPPSCSMCVHAHVLTLSNSAACGWVSLACAPPRRSSVRTQAKAHTNQYNHLLPHLLAGVP